jgi:hypothetical protein
VKRKQTQVGSTVLARLYNGRVVVAKITAIVNGPAGQKVHITFGAFALKIDPTQIIRTVQGLGAKASSSSGIVTRIDVPFPLELE